MKPFEIYIAFVSWGTDGKRRPVLVLSEFENQASVFQITTQYQNKSAIIRSKYILINDWRQAGLDNPSYIDANRIIELPIATIDPNRIGKLSERDIQNLQAAFCD